MESLQLIKNGIDLPLSAKNISSELLVFEELRVMTAIIESSFPLNEPPENDRAAFESASKIILQWDLSEAELLFDCHRYAINQYMEAVDEIQRWIEYPTRFNEAKSVMAMAMARLKHEFMNILNGGNGPRYSTCSSFSSDGFSYELHDDCIDYDKVSDESIADLRSIAERMTAAGYLPEFVRVYKSVRKLKIDVRFQLFGVENLSVGDVRWSEWEVLKTKIKSWIKAAKFCFRHLFANEKVLCEGVFRGLGEPDTSSGCFIAVVEDPTTKLFHFAETISTLRPSPERLFKVLDLYGTLSDLLPDLELLFDSNKSKSIRVEALVKILDRFKELVREILIKFEDVLICDISTIPAPGGTIHTLPIYVLKYIMRISVYEHTLTELIVSKPTIKTELDDLNILGTKVLGMDRTPFSLHLIWIIMILRFQLGLKSKLYEDKALAHLFMMNNVYYIVQQIIVCPELLKTIGDDYLKELTWKFRMAARSYTRSTWINVLHCFRDGGLNVNGSFSSGVLKKALKGRFKAFNNIFDEVHKTQATWLVPDSQLREDLRISISEKLIPAYRSFLGRYRNRIESGTHPENYIRYSIEDLENFLLDFFEGYPTSQHSRWR